jgi:hypothetical protein
VGGVGTGGSPLAAGGSAGVGVPGQSDDTVTRTDSTFTFSHYPIETNGDDVWSGAMTPGTAPTSTTFDTVILENGYLRVTILPSYGGPACSFRSDAKGWIGLRQMIWERYMLEMRMRMKRRKTTRIQRCLTIT